MLKILQINVNRSSSATESALDLAIKVDAKIVAIYRSPELYSDTTYPRGLLLKA
ncbi:hypothetical protein COCC4DRAFT_46031 [Bipolaris maydis ATCC 48331]|uniref:Uncharacterized protein n=1 Tax=Cochliobolus heterostrophus (strain C4 / ATCC 48331 / race T) TaxID=665024 RepID=N4WGX2_COCH4|nr:uncharacterized protein COCC4DRAFT_46031 [Bipolaris maydis ATCC 48331]ENH98489.1 hypothetical protein COCC4DRAFT_46031 [Bipolaris maydis ATCC 48331]